MFYFTGFLTCGKSSRTNPDFEVICLHLGLEIVGHNKLNPQTCGLEEQNFDDTFVEKCKLNVRSILRLI